MRQVLEQDVLQQVDMKVDDVELVRPRPHLVQHDEVTGDMVPDPCKAQRLGNTGDEFCGCLGIAARKQGHIMTLTHELLSQPGHHPLGPSIEFRWDGLG